ncbi:hypothetical protein KKE26_09330 [bacterium]|nr:hypothetical protein [bacterium]MBU1754543.1 hypothetical protein [bacterium]
MTEALVSKVWSYCNVLKDNGVGYGDYLKQLTGCYGMRLFVISRKSEKS